MSRLDQHDTVYRQNDGLLTIAKVKQEIDNGHSREDIMAGGLRCSHGSKMTYVDPKTKQLHFRHFPVARDPSRADTQSNDAHGPSARCPCSSVHMDAQALLRDHDYAKRPVRFTEWRDCYQPECCKTVFTADTRLVVKLEVREQGGRYVSDVEFYEYDKGPRLAIVEVYATHRADRERRQGLTFFEVRALHILEAFQRTPPGQPIVLRCEGASSGTYDVCQPCRERERQQEGWAEAARRRECKRQDEERRLEAEERRLETERQAEEDRQHMAVHGERLQHEAEERKRRAVEEAEEAEERKRRKAEEAMEAKRRAVEKRLVWDAECDDRALERAKAARRVEEQFGPDSAAPAMEMAEAYRLEREARDERQCQQRDEREAQERKKRNVTRGRIDFLIKSLHASGSENP